MATQKPNSGNRAQWVTALSMAIIAACLVLIVIHEYTSRPKEESLTVVEPSEPATTPAPASSKNIPAIARPKSSTPKIAKDESQPPSALLERVAETSLSAPSAAVPVVAGEKFVSTGLAPLTFLATNNSTIIKGRVILKGTPPPEAAIQLDAVCGRLNPTPITTRRYVVSPDGGLANVFVYIRGGLEHKKFPIPTVPAMLNQIDCQFQPYIVGLMAGQDLLITNSDGFLHNVDVTPLGKGNVHFNLAEGPGAVINKRFTNEEIPIRVHCDVHPWMNAFLCVVDHPFFAVTDQNGDYAITNVPSGNYDVAAFHVHAFFEGGKATSNSVNKDNKLPTERLTVKEGETTVANFVINAPNTSLAHK